MPQLSKAEEMLCDTEMFHAHINEVPGRSNINVNERNEKVFHSALLDEDYLLVGNYVDDQLRKKIGNGDYVDFVKLMPRDHVGTEDDHRMEMINKNGMTYWIPVADRETTAISSYAKWEQAFRVYSNIYTYFHPSRAGELIQYNHIIHTASQSFVWENVYRYDREFRIHMSRHHLVRSWSVILQQAWAMCLKDKLQGANTPNSYHGTGGGGHSSNNRGSHRGGPRRRLCFDFNNGNCTFAKKCKFDHHCSFCNKFGHGSFACRKAVAVAAKRSGGGETSHTENRWEKYEKDHNVKHADKKN